MFFGDRIWAVREMIMADDAKGREKALAKLLPMQRRDFFGIFKAMKGRPVTIRLLDPPLHEFVPKTREQADELSAATGVPAEDILTRAEQLHESNPMLGLRGVRLGIHLAALTPRGPIDSLNASVAAAVALYEARKQLMRSGA